MRKIILALAALLLVSWEFIRDDADFRPLKSSQNHTEFSIGAQIQSARIDRGMSIEDLSKLSGLSEKHLETVEENRGIPTRDFIVKLQEILEIEILLDNE